MHKHLFCGAVLEWDMHHHGNTNVRCMRGWYVCSKYRESNQLHWLQNNM